MPSLEKQAVLVTGCSSGIGRALARALKASGHRPFATARRLEAISDLADEGIETLPLDVRDASSVASAVQEVIARAGRIDVLVNNAGLSIFGPI
ncbi:MAG TPA: SDR family NAD(P)-dependent oxidoreductase, partial [Polyangiaceae bacterium]|nr:SDR family NAD(P)-dependent oxidoreductase [Polyangiaceae bacterium]